MCWHLPKHTHTQTQRRTNRPHQYRCRNETQIDVGGDADTRMQLNRGTTTTRQDSKYIEHQHQYEQYEGKYYNRDGRNPFILYNMMQEGYSLSKYYNNIQYAGNIACVRSECDKHDYYYLLSKSNNADGRMKDHAKDIVIRSTITVTSAATPNPENARTRCHPLQAL